MRKIMMILTATAFALAVSPANAQVGKTPAPKQPTKVVKKTNTSTKKASDKTAGIVKGEAKGSKFTLGSKSGQYMVDASTAKCTYKGKSFKVNDLKGGNMVVVVGKPAGKTIKATEVKVTFIKGQTSTKKLTPKTPKPKTIKK